LQTFEMLAEEENFAGLARLNRALIARAEAMDSGDRTVLDLDSSEIPVLPTLNFFVAREDLFVLYGKLDCGGLGSDSVASVANQD
jgi:hypothetical protein